MPSCGGRQIFHSFAIYEFLMQSLGSYSLRLLAHKVSLRCVTLTLAALACGARAMKGPGAMMAKPPGMGMTAASRARSHHRTAPKFLRVLQFWNLRYYEHVNLHILHFFDISVGDEWWISLCSLLICPCPLVPWLEVG